MLIPFVERFPEPWEIEKLRLVLSTYQDGSGMLVQKGGGTLPGWRDFERTIAAAFQGIAQESKYVFDVLFSNKNGKVSYGLSCKMRRELNKVDTLGRATLELSNSARKFWDYLNTKGIDQANYTQQPGQVGASLIELVKRWHTDVSVPSGGPVELSRSSYLVLLWSKTGWYQLFQYSLQLPDPSRLKWYYPNMSKRIVGEDSSGIVLEWYRESGGQLKYYPKVGDAIWMSSQFRLEPIPSNFNKGVLVKTAQYFPHKWKHITEIERQSSEDRG